MSKWEIIRKKINIKSMVLATQQETLYKCNDELIIMKQMKTNELI